MDEKMKVLAMYLPQFHRVKENDEWWGDGFTDWVSAKNAVPLFEGHYQPRIPKNKKFYDLMNKGTLEWQASLMHQYGVDGMCFYHYWFKDGRKILERPAENLLQWKDVAMPFCFYWANETWAYSWSNIKDKNVWMNKGENKEYGGEDGILLKQEYGNETEWEKHLDYLVPFFKDSRYIKIDNKPLFLIYKSADIDCLADMLTFWRRKICEFGFDGIYVIGSFCDAKSGDVVDAELCLEPPGGMRNLYRDYTREGLYRIQYEDVWEKILKEGSLAAKTYFGGFVGFDDTPRRGNKGIVVENETPEVFCEYLSKLMAKNAVHGNDMVFINAWNEWGEGMYLEPDELYGTAFLEAITKAKKNYTSYFPMFRGIERNEYVTYLRIGKEKFSHYFGLLDKWLLLKENGETIGNKLKSMGIFSILVYGYGAIGKHLIADLSNSDIKILGVIDKRKDRLKINYPAYLPTDRLPVCDAVIVTADYYFYEIEKALSESNARVIAMRELLG